MRALVRSDGKIPEAATSDSPSDTSKKAESQLQKRQRHNARRRQDILGEAHPATWRMLIIKVATRVVVSARRVRLIISNSWPNLPHFQRTVCAICKA